jgi:hypothetical protein
MIRKLLTTTAVAALLATGAIAQDNTAAPPATSLTPSTGDMMTNGYMPAGNDWLTSRVLG